MIIEYLGHSCFKFTDKAGTSIVCDPYDNSLGLTFPKVFADAVTVSHGHHDHNAVSEVSGTPIIFDKYGSYHFRGIEISTVKSFHDREMGAKRGNNLIFKYNIDGLNICHLGDLGEDSSPELVEKLFPVNVLLIPVGGFYTIDALTAKKYVEDIKPDIVIPMHYRVGGCNLNIERVDNFLTLFNKEIIEEADGEIELTRSNLNGRTKIIVLRRD